MTDDEVSIILHIDDSKQPECEDVIEKACYFCGIRQRFRVRAVLETGTVHIISACAYCGFKHGKHIVEASGVVVEKKGSTVICRFKGTVRYARPNY